MGDNLLFVRAFAKIQGLEKLIIKGFYAKHWPSYLKETMNAQVQIDPGRHIESRADDTAADVIWKRKLNEENFQSFIEYQGGTEDLIP